MECPKCGALNAEGAQFCSLCQEAFDNPSPKSTPQDKSEQPKPEEPKADEPTPEVDEKEKTKTESSKHTTPGFGVVKKEPEKPSKINEEKETPKTEAKVEKKAKKTSSFNLTDWLLPAALASLIAILISILIPSNQFMENMPIGKILLLASIIGVVVSSGGIIQLDFKKAITGWLLGLSGGFLAFNILFFGSFLFIKISPTFYTRFFLGSEILVISATIGLAIGFSLWMEKIQWVSTLILSAIVIASLVAVAWILSRFTTFSIPIITFIAWPLGYYLLHWQQTKAEKVSTE